MQSICREAFDNRGTFNLCFVSWRGHSGSKLMTPQIHNALAVNDAKEPIEYIYDKYCKPSG